MFVGLYCASLFVVCCIVELILHFGCLEAGIMFEFYVVSWFTYGVCYFSVVVFNM